jgi:hypothetical protein
MSTQADVEWRVHPREYWIGRIDQARGVITLTVHALLSDNGPDNADAACALDLANEELQRLRDEIDASRLEELLPNRAKAP